MRNIYLVLSLCIGLLLIGCIKEESAEAAFQGKPVSHWIRMLKDKDASSRRKAAIALGEIGPRAREGVPALTQALRDQDAEVHYRAAIALGSIRSAPTEERPVLIPTLKTALQKTKGYQK